MYRLDLLHKFNGGRDGAEGEKARIMVRCCCTLVVCLGASFLFSSLLVLVAMAMTSSPASNPLTVSSICRIVSTSVDIKASRVCELGFLKLRAEYVFHSKKKAAFRCQDDYYWASIFEVEFKEYFSGQFYHAVVEAPKEALPLDCRPNFDGAWMTKMRFKVNETYKCMYNLGSQKPDIYPDSLFNCQPKVSSLAEIFIRSFVLFTRPLSEWSTAGCQMGYTLSGIVLGMLTSMCFIILVKVLHAAMHLMQSLRRLFLLVAYFSAVCWLLLQYRKLIGLKQFFFNSLI